jgi:hypothetical protein
MRRLWLDLFLIDKIDLSKLSVVELLALTIPFVEKPFKPIKFTIPSEDNTMSFYLKWLKKEENDRINSNRVRYSMYIFVLYLMF